MSASPSSATWLRRAARVVDAASALLVVLISAYVAYNAIELGSLTTGQTTGSGLPLELTFYPMGVGALFMTVFAIDQLCAGSCPDIVRGLVAVARRRRPLVRMGLLSPGRCRRGRADAARLRASRWSAACRSALRWRWPR